MPHPQSCHLEEGGENGEAEEEVEVSFEVGGIRRSWRKGCRTLIQSSSFIQHTLTEEYSEPGPGLGDVGDTAVTKLVHWGDMCITDSNSTEYSWW